MPPSSDQRLFDAQPPSTTPYTPSDAIASTKRRPTLSSAPCRLITRPPTSSTSPNGTTAKVASAGTRLAHGARKWSSRSASAGVMSSFRRNLIGSATSVFTRPSPAKPKIAARLAPMRSWMRALTLRSKNTPRPITWIARKRAKRTFAAAMATSGATLRVGQPLDQGERPLDGQVLVVLGVVHLQDGRRVAGGEALDLLEREAPVGGLLAGTDAEPLLERGPRVVRPAQGARQVAADLEVPAARRLLPVHGIERRGGGHPRERQLHQLGHVLEDRQREPPDLALRGPRGGQQGRAALGVAGEDRPVLAEDGVGEARALSGHTRLRSC